MDINFHYFAVKTIASFVGFEEEQAQKIAGYSQFVDDFNAWTAFQFDIVPSFVSSLGLVKINSNGKYELTPITTGFDGYFDYASLVMESMQTQVVMPFHFIPPCGYIEGQKTEKRYLYRTVPADIDGTFIISRLLQSTKKDYLQDRKFDFVEHRESLLVKIGILLHIFADTYAHQGFSGLRGWENYSYLTTETDNYNGNKSIIDQESPSPMICGNLPSIGHGNVGHAPDNSYASFSIKYAENANQTSESKYTAKYNRSNTQTFMIAARQIYTYLYQLRNDNRKPTVQEEYRWRELQEYLRNGFNARGSYQELKNHWDNCCHKFNYHYDKADYLTKLMAITESSDSKSRIYYTAQNDFFLFNYYAKRIRFEVLGA